MAFIIVFSNIWALIFHEWKGSGRRTHRLVFLVILTLVGSISIVGLGIYLESLGKQGGACPTDAIGVQCTPYKY